MKKMSTQSRHTFKDIRSWIIQQARVLLPSRNCALRDFLLTCLLLYRHAWYLCKCPCKQCLQFLVIDFFKTMFFLICHKYFTNNKRWSRTADEVDLKNRCFGAIRIYGVHCINNLFFKARLKLIKTVFTSLKRNLLNTQLIHYMPYKWLIQFKKNVWMWKKLSLFEWIPG